MRGRGHRQLGRRDHAERRRGDAAEGHAGRTGQTGAQDRHRGAASHRVVRRRDHVDHRHGTCFATRLRSDRSARDVREARPRQRVRPALHPHHHSTGGVRRCHHREAPIALDHQVAPPRPAEGDRSCPCQVPPPDHHASAARHRPPIRRDLVHHGVAPRKPSTSPSSGLPGHAHERAGDHRHGQPAHEESLWCAHASTLTPVRDAGGEMRPSVRKVGLAPPACRPGRSPSSRSRGPSP